MKKIIFTLYYLAIFSTMATAQLQKVAVSNTVWNGVTVSNKGRMFVCFPHLEGGDGMRIGEVLPGNKIVAYPNQSWNNWKPGNDVNSKIIRPNALRIGPDGNLWIVDTGSPALGTDPLPGNAAKLVVVNIEQNKVIRIIPLAGVAKKHSFFDDLRIINGKILLTDAGEPAIIVLDLKTGKGKRVLENHAATIDKAALYAEGKVITTTDGKPLKVNADQLEVSPDGKWFYFQPVSGPLSRIPLPYLVNDKYTPAQQAAQVKIFYHTPTTGGTCIDAAGNIYVSDVDKLQILKITPDGKATVVVKDKRLVWCDAMWLDSDGYLYMPCAQINRLGAFQKGQNRVQYPVVIYKIKTSSKPFKS